MEDSELSSFLPFIFCLASGEGSVCAVSGEHSHEFGLLILTIMRPDCVVLAWLRCARLRKKRSAPYLIILLHPLVCLPTHPLAPSPFQPGRQAGGPG